MKVFLTGATGVLGRPTVHRLLEAGHHVTAVARDDRKAARLRESGATPVLVDLFDAEAVVTATRGQEVIAHLATNVPPVRSAGRKGAWSTHNRLRTEATRNLVAAGLANGVSRFVKESITFTYPDCADSWITENTPVDDSAVMLEPTTEGERLALGFAESDRRAAVLRFGLFYGGTGNRGTDEMLRLARFRLSTIAGRPDAYMSSVHVEDAATSVVHALGLPTGVYNVVDEEPLTRREYLDAFSDAFRLKRLHPVPSWLLRTVGGKAAAALVASQRVSNQRFEAAAGWAPRYPSAREGWAAEARRREQEVSHG